jgi:hypothetical protein
VEVPLEPEAPETGSPEQLSFGVDGGETGESKKAMLGSSVPPTVRKSRATGSKAKQSDADKTTLTKKASKVSKSQAETRKAKSLKKVPASRVEQAPLIPIEPQTKLKTSTKKARIPKTINDNNVSSQKSSKTGKAASQTSKEYYNKTKPITSKGKADKSLSLSRSKKPKGNQTTGARETSGKVTAKKTKSSSATPVKNTKTKSTPTPKADSKPATTKPAKPAVKKNARRSSTPKAAAGPPPPL